MEEMLKRIDNKINEYYQRTFNYANISSEDVDFLLKVLKDELKVDIVYIVVTSIDKKSFKFINYISDSKKSLVGKEVEISLESYLSQHMLYDEFNLSTMPGVDVGLNDKAHLYHGLVRGNDTDGTIGVIDTKCERKWTAFEKEALIKVSRCLHLYVYEKRVSMLKNQDIQNQKELHDIKCNMNVIKGEIYEILNLIVSSSNDILARIVKFNMDTNEGSYFKFIDGKVVEVKDNNCIDELVSFYNSRLDNKDIDISYELNTIPYNVIKSYQFNSYECLGKIEPDNYVHNTSIRIIKTRLNEQNYILALLVDLTDYNNRQNESKYEVEKFKNLLLSTLTKDFNDLTRFDLKTREIYKYYSTDGKLNSKVYNLPWDTLVNNAMNNVIGENLEEIRDFLKIENISKLDLDTTKKFIVKRKTLTGDEKFYSMFCKLLGTYDHKTFLLYTLDITRQVKQDVKIQRLNQEINTDGLTRIYNRNALYNNIKEINSCIVDGKDSYLLFLDVDKFKSINDEYGHFEGDKALINIANVLSDFAKENNGITFRNGGDEFILVVSIDYDIKELINNINNLLKNKFSNVYLLEVTVGIAKLDSDIKTIDVDTLNKLIINADLDLIKKKKEKNLGR